MLSGLPRRALGEPTEDREDGPAGPARAAGGVTEVLLPPGRAAGAGEEGDDPILLGVGDADAVSVEARGAALAVGGTVELAGAAGVG